MPKRVSVPVVVALTMLAATGCSVLGGGFNGTDLAGLKRIAATQFLTVPQAVTCRNSGVWIDLDGGRREVSYCYVEGRAAWQSGCYDSNTHENLTFAIRATQDGKRLCAAAGIGGLSMRADGGMALRLGDHRSENGSELPTSPPGFLQPSRR